MFVYCGNSPVLLRDTTGTRHEISAGGGGKPRPYVKRTPLVKKAFDYITNTDEKEVLDDDLIDFYKGVPVVKLPMGTDAFSYGVIFLGDQAGNRYDPIETVQHEYGHAIHFRISPIGYTLKAFLPSVIGFHFGDIEYEDYYSYVYEYTADILGGVDRRVGGTPYSYKQSTEDWWLVYFLYSII